jgi:hypothetical protein
MPGRKWISTIGLYIAHGIHTVINARARDVDHWHRLVLTEENAMLIGTRFFTAFKIAQKPLASRWQSHRHEERSEGLAGVDRSQLSPQVRFRPERHPLPLGTLPRPGSS